MKIINKIYRNNNIITIIIEIMNTIEIVVHPRTQMGEVPLLVLYTEAFEGFKML